MVVNQEWQRMRLPILRPAEVQRLIAEHDPVILDVRPLNFPEGPHYIEGSVLCPLVYLVEFEDLVPKDRPLLVTDWAMQQAVTGAKYFISKGYNVLGVLRGGVERWVSEGLPTERREGGTARVGFIGEGQDIPELCPGGVCE